MPNFIYTGHAKDGSKMSGEMEARNADDVARQLRSIDVYPLKIIEKSAKENPGLANLQITIGNPNKLKTDDLVFFSRQLHTLLKSSVPIMNALEGLESTTDQPALKRSIKMLRDSLNEGLNLTQALQRQDNIYPPLFISLVDIGEKTGKLAYIFKDLSEYLQKEQETKTKVKAALRYPIIVLTTILLGLVIVNIFVIPNFATMYASFNAELPLPTRILMAFSDFMLNYWYLCLGIPIAITYGLIRYTSTPHGKMQWHKKIIKIPLFGKLIMQSAITRFSRSLSITATAGVPMIDALRIIAPVTGNMHIEQKINEMRTGLERGESISLNAKRIGIFPDLVLQMISVGEQAGTLDVMIGEVADYYEREIEHTIKALTAAIEPLMVLIIGGLVLVLALGIFLPMISFMGAINK